MKQTRCNALKSDFFRAVVYPNSNFYPIQQCIQNLLSLGCDVWARLHDMDKPTEDMTDADFELESTEINGEALLKPHWHLVIFAPYKLTETRIQYCLGCKCKLFLGVPYGKTPNDFCRYLFHYDHPQKYQYQRDEHANVCYDAHGLPKKEFCSLDWERRNQLLQRTSKMYDDVDSRYDMAVLSYLEGEISIQDLFHRFPDKNGRIPQLKRTYDILHPEKHISTEAYHIHEDRLRQESQARYALAEQKSALLEKQNKEQEIFQQFCYEVANSADPEQAYWANLSLPHYQIIRKVLKTHNESNYRN